ncbi:MAG: response regulator [Lewinellaceae bacterium]|nr:response regulator [Lewinellaceae bacterium]
MAQINFTTFRMAARQYNHLFCAICLVLGCCNLVAQPANEIQALQKRFKQTPQDTATVNIALQLGQYYFATSSDSFLFYNNWVERFSRQQLSGKQPLGENRQRFYQSALSISLREKGYYQQRKRWDVNAALASYEEALVWAERSGDARSLALALNNMANVYENQGDLKTALDYYQKALNLLEKIGGNALAICLDDIGKLNLSLGDLNKAEESCRRSLEISEKIGANEQVCIATIHLGGIFTEKEAFATAQDYFKKALAIAHQEGNSLLLALAYRYLGICLEKQGNKQQALEAHQSGLDYAVGINYIKGAAQSHFYISKLLYGQQQEQAAFDHARQSFDLSQQAGIPLNIKESAAWLSQLYAESGNPEKALELYQLSVTMKDSVFNAGNRRDMIRQQMQFEFDKKEAIALREKQVQRTILLAVAICLLLALGLVVFIWRNLRTKEQQRRIIEAQKTEVEMRNAQIEAVSKTIRKQAQELRRVDEMKTRFFANISHELRTPLTLIMGQIDSVRSRLNDARLKEKLSMASTNGSRLLELINQLLDLSKLEAGKMHLQVAPADLVHFLRYTFNAFELLAEEKQIRLAFESTVESLEVFFEKEKMGRVFFNLLSNAIKFTPPDSAGTITLRISKKGPDAAFPGGSAEITVSDTGVGIPEDRLPYIFDRFYQVDDSNTREWEGTGIGLALVKELVKLHRGSVRVESVQGSGSSFTVQLPLGSKVFHKSEIGVATAGPAAGIHPEELDAGASGNGAQTTGIPQAEGAPSLLVVEDNPDMRAYLCDHLLEAGYAVTAAANGEEGLANAQEQLPDLIITDVMMPRMNGNELSRRLRADERTSHIPIVMLTAKAGEEAKIEGLETGVDGYLTKPFSERELLVRVKNLIQLRRQLRQRFSTATTIRPAEVSATPMDQQFLQKIIETIEANLSDEHFGVEPLSAAVNMSVTHLNRKLNALIDQPAGSLIRSMRLQRAADLLERQAASVSEIAWQVGFAEAAHFTRSFKQQFGSTPTEWVKTKAGKG